MEDIKEITISEFENQGIKYNKNGTKRSYFDVIKHLSEYEDGFEVNLDDYSVVLLQAELDKDSANDFIELLKKHNFLVFQSPEILYANNLKRRLVGRPKTVSLVQDLKNIEAILEKYKNMPLYTETENDDVFIYFLPRNEKVTTLYDFFKVYRKVFLDFALKNDLTMLFRAVERKGRVNGFFAFNYLDQVNDEVKSYDYASRFVYKSNPSSAVLFVEECENLCALGKNKLELKDLNTIIVEGDK